MDKKEIYLIDGSAYLHRAFHAIKNLSTSTGHPTNATFGFTRILLKLLKEKQPEFAVVFFDVKGPTFRHKMYKEYKANRPPMEESMAVQIPDIKKVVNALNITIVEKQGFEADDLVGTYARLAQEQGFKVVMVTGDKDFIQLITEDCLLWDPMKDKEIDIAQVKKDFDISPLEFIDMLGLAGDKSDNIPGVPGIGLKIASSLIAQYKSIENIYTNIEDLKKKKKLYENLLENKENALLSKDLATIDRFVEEEISLDAFKIVNPDKEKASALFREYEFKTLAMEYAGAQDLSKKEYKLLTKLKDIENYVKDLEKCDVFALDTETTSKTPMLAELVGLSFSYKKDQAVYIPVGHIDSGEFEQPDKNRVLQILKPLLQNPEIKKVGQNIKYDYIVLAKCGIKLEGIVFDTMIGSYLLNPSTRGHSLDQIAMTLFGHKTISYEEITGKGKNQIGFEEVAISEAVNYASEDADITFMAYEKLLQDIKDFNLYDLMTKIEIPLVPVLAAMEMEGIKIDREQLNTLSKVFKQEIDILEQEIYSLSGQIFNINSSQQLGEILFEKLNLPVIKKTKKTKGYSTDVEVLTALSQKHELPAKVLRYRTLGKLKTTYVDALSKIANPETDRVHTSFNQTITATGRLSSSNPNLQNIPIRTEEGKKIREAFIPKQGFSFVSADYSQIELRILAHCANDEILIKAFQNNEDIHTRTAMEVFDVISEFVTNDLRSQAKAINFGIVYGMSAYGLSKELDISRKMAQNYIDNYFARYAGVKRFIDSTIKEAEKNLEVETLLGRKRKVSEINSSNINVKKFAQRVAINMPIQGSAADLIKLAMIEMSKAISSNNLKSKILLSVHDEIIFEVPANEEEALTKLAKHVMENLFSLKVPLVVNIGSGNNWAQAH
ncbi:MAG: DNA polymerase I [Desulfobacterales bacterium]|nr:DNA polymerase I [Desulfobacterales bacterium]